MKLKVWLLDYDWGEDHSLSAHSRQEDANTALQAIVYENWDVLHPMDDVECPEDPQEAVEQYFNKMDEENYAIWPVDVDFPQLDILGPMEGEEILLTYKECEVIVDLAEAPGAHHFASKHLLDSVSKKLKI